jgi:hypothetical protein
MDDVSCGEDDGMEMWRCYGILSVTRMIALVVNVMASVGDQYRITIIMQLM